MLGASYYFVCLTLLMPVKHLLGNESNETDSKLRLKEEIVQQVVFGLPKATAADDDGHQNVSLSASRFSVERLPDSQEKYVLNKKQPFKKGGSHSIGVVAPVQGCPSVCKTAQGMAGTCVQAYQCQLKGGVHAGPCCGTFLVCCQVAHHCGDSSNDELVTFQSYDYPLASRGTLACDFDLHILPDTCAVRLDFHRVRFYKKFGGVCDVDQFFIVNSVDGPTNAQCGDLTGYSTTVAVRPGQELPLKLIIVVQNEGYYIWDMRLQQVKCSELSYLKRPQNCGTKEPLNDTPSFYQFLDLWKNNIWQTDNQQQYHDVLWWRPQMPSFNRFQMWADKMLNGEDFQQIAEEHQQHQQQYAEERIIGGTDAELHEFPWEAAIVLKRMFFCAGSLINEEFVLSAAHCFLTQDTSVNDLVVFLGDHDLTRSNDTQSDIRGVRQIHYHAHFHALRLSNDIALLQLDRPVAFSQRIRPICLPDKVRGNFGSSNYGTVAGWGITSYPEGRPNAVLQKLEVEVLTNKICEARLQETLGPGNLCAIPRGRRGTCFGDSGGPLSINYNGRATLIGIVSFGITGCAMAPGQPDLYTRVSEYIRWIDVGALKVPN